MAAAKNDMEAFEQNAKAAKHDYICSPHLGAYLPRRSLQAIVSAFGCKHSVPGAVSEHRRPGWLEGTHGEHRTVRA